MRPPATTRRPARPAFTLVELLVAAALSVIIMYVLATAFKTGLDTLSGLKSVGGLSDQVRTAEAALANDLAAVHLEDETGKPVPVSSDDVKNLAWLGDGSTPESKAKPKRGFFKVAQLTAGTSEGLDGDNVPSARCTDHWLHLTVRLPGRDASTAFTGFVQGGLVTPLQEQSLKDFVPAGNVGDTFAGRWAEVAYFLKATPVMTDGGAIPLHTLFRQVRILVPNEMATNGTGATPPGLLLTTAEKQAIEQVISTRTAGPNGRVNTPETITAPGNRSIAQAGPAVPTATASDGSDILLSNVVSMQVQVMTDNNTTFGDLPDGLAGAAPGVYDTSDAPAATKHRLRAVQIKLRVYDPKNRITRQVTITQQL